MNTGLYHSLEEARKTLQAQEETLRLQQGITERARHHYRYVLQLYLHPENGCVNPDNIKVNTKDNGDL